jgi:hypothetical protein
VRTDHKLLVPALLFLVILACRNTSAPLAFSPPELQEAQVGQPYGATITVSGNRTPVFLISVDSGELPPGLTLHYEEGASTARIEGVPETAGEFELTVHASCFGTNVSGQTGERSYTLLVKQE